jgi:tetratricopeptide (TPR) repeat protein
MASREPTNSPAFRLVVKGLLQLHELSRQGQDDSAEAEAVRDALDGPLSILNDTDKERAQWLSEDLYSVSGPDESATLQPMTAEAQLALTEAVEARESGEFDRALKLIRRWESYISPALLSYLRGTVWLDAGYPEVAAVFLKHASELDASNGNYRATYLTALDQSDPKSALEDAQKVINRPQDWAPAVVVRAADVAVGQLQDASVIEPVAFGRQITLALEDAVSRMDQGGDPAAPISTYGHGVLLLGMCYERLGDVNAAANWFTRGLQHNPDNDRLLAARGILLYGKEPGAIADLKRAVSVESNLIWPYLFLAHHFLSMRDFERARVMCEMGLHREGSASAKSLLEEWRAIAQAELGFPPNTVRAAFESAVRLDSSNDLARRNAKIFEQALAKHDPRPISNWEQRSEATVRQLGLVERRYSLGA